MDSLQIAVLVIIHQISLAGGVVTITFDDNGYIGQSIVLQCKTNDTFIANNGVWFINGRLISSITSGRYSEIKTPDGFNLTISDLTTAHAGYYRCVIDFGSSSNKTLGILYNTSIEITDNPSTFAVTITIIAYPAPEYSVTLTKNGSLVTVTWASTNITRPDGAFKITLISTLMEMDYELTVDVTRTVPAFRRYFVKFAPPPKTTTDNNGTTDNNETGIQHLTVIIGASCGGGVFFATIITVTIIVRKKRRDHRKKRNGNKYEKEPDQSNHNQAIMDQTPANHEWNMSLQEEDKVPKSNPNNQMSKSQMQSSNQSSNQTSTSHQESKVKPLSKENVVQETKYVKPETTVF